MDVQKEPPYVQRSWRLEDLRVKEDTRTQEWCAMTSEQWFRLSEKQVVRFMDNPPEVDTTEPDPVETAADPPVETVAAPVVMKLPFMIYFDHKHPDLPDKKVYAVMMRLGPSSGAKKQPRYVNSSIFILAPGIPPPAETEDLYEWALQERNCPVALRFRSISYSITYLTSLPQARFYVPKLRQYRFWKSLWKVLRTNERLSTIIPKIVENEKYDAQRTQHADILYHRSAKRVEGADRAATKMPKVDRRTGRSSRKAKKRRVRKPEVAAAVRIGDGRHDQKSLCRTQSRTPDPDLLHVLPEDPVNPERGVVEQVVPVSLPGSCSGAVCGDVSPVLELCEMEIESGSYPEWPDISSAFSADGLGSGWQFN